MNKKILRVNYDYDFTLIGIISPVRAYRLCWFLNNYLEMDLHKEDDHSLKNSHQEDVYFSKYGYNVEESETDYFVIGNKGTEGYLISENKEIDYFMLIYNLPQHGDKELLIKKMKQINGIQSAFSVDPGKLRSKENLLF